MTPAELDENIGVLSREDTHYLQKNWEASARWIFEQAGAGADIAAAVPALVAVYLEATQIGVLRATAAAVAVHDLRAGNIGGLRKLLEKGKYRDWIFDGIGDALAKEVSLAPAVELLLEYCVVRPYSVVHLLLRHAGKRGFAAVARLVAQRAPGSLPEFLKEAQAKKIPVEAALPDLASQLLDEDFARNAATAFRWLVELGADLSGVRKPLEEQLDAKDEEIAAEAGYSLAYHHAARQEWPAVDALLGANRPQTAWAAARALRVRLLGGRGVVPEIVDRVAAGLLSADSNTSSGSLAALREAKSRKLRCAPSPEMTSRLAASLDDHVAEYLHFALPAARVRKLRPEGSPAARERLAAAARRPDKACTICARLPRSGNWNYGSDLPPEYSKLVGAEGLSHCPECGRAYGRHYEEEWDDMSHSETWSLIRYTPAEVLAATKGVAHQEYRKALAGWIARFREELDHPALGVRQEAAYDLAAHFASNGDWAELAALVASSGNGVLLRVLDSLRGRPEDLSPILEPLRGLLASPDAGVRSRTAAILATRSVGRNDLAALRELLEATDSGILAAATEAIFQGSLRAFDTAPLFDRLAALRLRPESSIFAPVRRILTSLAAKPGAPDALSLLIEDLSSDVAEVRTSAAFAIRQVAPSRPDAATAIPRLIALLGDPECVSWSKTALQALEEAGADILQAVPAIAACVLDPDCSCRPEMICWLQRLHAKGADLRPHIAALAGLLAGDESTQSATHQVLQDIFRSGGDISAAVAPLRAMLEDAPPYIREYGARLLTEWHVKTGDLEGLRFLLRHRNAEPPGICADVLRRLQFDLTPLLPDLILLTRHPKSWVRGQSSGALVAFAKSGAAARERVLATLEGSGESAELRREILRT